MTNIVKSTRIERNMTQQNLANAAGITQSLVSQIEHGKRKASVNTLYKISQVLGCTIDDLVRGEMDAKGKTSNGSTARG